MRVLILVHNIHGYGGSFTRCANLGRQLAALGHDITLAAVSRDSRYRSRVVSEPRMRYFDAPMGLGGHYQGGGWGVLDTLARIARYGLGRFDLVYPFEHRPDSSLPAFCQRLFRRPLLISDWADAWTVDGGILTYARNFPLQFEIERFLEAQIRRSSDGVTAISADLCARARRLGVPGGRILHLPSGADVERIRPLPKDRMREAHGIARDVLLIGFISANLIDSEMLMRGMAKVFAARPGCRLLFIGPDRGYHHDLAIQLGIEDRIIWAGFQPYGEVPGYLACCDLMVIPRSDNAVNRGGVPVKILEYIAAGKATVACAVGDIQRIFREDAIGLLAAPEADDFAAKTLELLDQPRLIEEMGARARGAAETKYSWRSAAERFCAFLRDLPEAAGLGI